MQDVRCVMQPRTKNRGIDLPLALHPILHILNKMANSVTAPLDLGDSRLQVGVRPKFEMITMAFKVSHILSCG